VKRTNRRKDSARNRTGAVTRREFARQAAAAAAAMVALPAGIALPAATAAAGAATPPVPPPHSPALARQEAPGSHPKLSEEALAEAEARTTEILRRYGAKLTETQKADVRRLSQEAQVPLEALRRFPLENSDEPATVLQLVRTTPMRRPPASQGSGARKPAREGR